MGEAYCWTWRKGSSPFADDIISSFRLVYQAYG